MNIGLIWHNPTFTADVILITNNASEETISGVLYIKWNLYWRTVYMDTLQHHLPSSPDVDPQSRDPATYRPIPRPLISWSVYKGHRPGQGRWSPELHYIMTEEVIRQCGGEGVAINYVPFFLCVSCSFQHVRVTVQWAWSVFVSLNQFEGVETIQGAQRFVCVSLPNDLLWQMMSHKQTQASQLSVHANKLTNKQTNKQRRQTNGPSGRVTAEFKMINHS